MELEVVIGLEIHAQLNSKSKLFCRCDNDAFGAAPNSRVCPICMGFPGMLPVPNREAIQKAAIGAAALGCDVQPYSKFDRKNYFYPDLPNGFQITQFDQPIGLDGEVEIDIKGDRKIIKIERLHLEIDAGKLTHSGQRTLCDYNRSGTPLAEIVTGPDMRSAEEAQELAKMVQKTLRFSGASDADMEKGMMRFDASVSMRPKGERKLYPRAEIKNLNSFTSLHKAIKYEIGRQKKLWEDGTPQTTACTVGWLDDEEKTQILRSKENANEYRYLPEPDLAPVVFTEKEIKEITDSIPETPLQRYDRYKSEFGLNHDDAYKLSSEPELAYFFETAVSKSKNQKKAANLILSVVLADTFWHQKPITPQHISDTVNLIEEGVVSNSAGKEIIITAMETGESAENIMENKGLQQNSDTSQLEAWVDEAIEKNQSSVEDYLAGKEKAIGAVMGYVMKLSKGAANPPMVMKMILEKIKK